MCYSFILLLICLSSQSFGDLPHRPLLVDLTVEEGQRLKVIYGSCAGFHAIDVDSGNNYDIYIPVHVSYAVMWRFFHKNTLDHMGSDQWFVGQLENEEKRFIDTKSPLFSGPPLFHSLFLSVHLSVCRSSHRWILTPSYSCPVQMGWRCCCVMRMRVFTSTRMGASLKMWCCSGEKCPLLWVSMRAHTRICFCELWGHSIGVRFFYTVQTVFSIVYIHLNLPLTGNFVHFYFLKKTNSVWFISLLNHGDMGKCPHKSPYPCNSYVTPMSLYKFVSSYVSHTHTHRIAKLVKMK